MVKLVQNVGVKAYRYPQKDLQVLARYANGLEVNPKKEKITDGLTVMNIMSYPLTMSAYDGYRWVKNNKGNYKEAFQKVTQEAKSINNVLKKTGVQGVLRNVDAKNVLASIPEEEYLNTLSSATKDLYKKAQSYATAAASTTGNIKGALKQANQHLTEANAAAYAERAANATGIFSKVKNALGITAVNKGLNNLAAKSPVFSKCLDAYRNESGTFMLVLEGGMEAATNVVPTFKKLGAKRGFKQLGKSAATTVSSVAGWVAGSALGSKVGSIIKAATGSTKAGAVLGVFADKACSYIGGSIVQHFASKGAQKLVGKSELEKAKEEEVNALAEMAQNDEEVLQALLVAANERMEAEGIDNPNYLAVQEACQNLVASQQPSPMMTREQLAQAAQALEDNQTVVSQPQQQVNASLKQNDSERAQAALRNSEAFMTKVSNSLLK